MEMNWSTFGLEILNFLILVWILKRFLYKPVQEIIARRKAGIEKTLTDAKKFHTEAERLQEKYESRLADWEREKQQAQVVLNREIEAEHDRRLAELITSLEQEREKFRVADERRQADAMRKMEETALQHGVRFAAYLLEKASGPETEIRLVELVIAELSGLQDERIEVLRSSVGNMPEEVVVVTAFPLPDDLCQRLKQTLEKISGPKISMRFEQDKELLAGVKITIGSWVLGANLRDELKGFATLAHTG